MSAYTPEHVFDQPAPRFDLAKVETPAFVVDLGLLKENLEKLAMVQRESGAKVLLALKGFAMFSTFPLVKQYLSGCCASGLHEALLAHEEFGKEVHVYAPAFKAHEMGRIIPIADHISFNSLAQWRAHRPAIEAARAAGKHAPSPGLRVNPEHSEVEVALYDPCSPGCRLGTRSVSLEEEDLSGLEGLHFHALCEQDSDVLERTLAAVEQRFPKLLAQARWVNMGGGHHITRKGYDIDRLIRVVRDFKQRTGKEVYLEPGEAVALNTGYLIVSVMDVVGQSAVAKSENPITLKQSHELHRPHLFPERSQADRDRAARALHKRLEETARATHCADAAERINAEAQSIRAWAEENGWLIAPSTLESVMGDVTELEGASEHDVFLDAPNGRVIKLTKTPNFGARGEARTYLENVLACRHLFQLDWDFEGVVAHEDGIRLVTSQTFIEGERTEIEQIDSHFAMLGFSKVRENTYRNDQQVTVTDARADNILRDSNGLLHFIDVHVLGLNVEQIPTSAPVAETFLPTAILDTSATCHMPDTLEMPYRPHIIDSGLPGEFPHTYKLGGMSCLAGDVVNEYSFREPLQIGQKLAFTDMAHYTMVKTTTFNGVPHPDLDLYDPATGEVKVVRRIGYEEFKGKLS